ncbi:hypothetical protein GCM10010921_23770 [Microbacterium album]|uniref:Uncharacterized protein n=1 Tax=Microbacterium album TaxID=2053191 RepID=A0A917IG66_9MICO|nr:hypothetical protein [Microbacterium album]GGH47197.1 hypothetical protein GCM10010921_23770 [Microbacterium album]
MPAANDAHERVGEQRLTLARNALMRGRHQHVLPQEIDRVRIVEGVEAHGDAGRLVRQQAQERRRHHGEGVVGGRDPELPGTGAWVEARSHVDDPLHLRDRFGHDRPERFRAGSEHPPTAMTHEDRVVDQFAKLRQGVSDGGLRHPDAFSCAREAALAEHCVVQR